MLRTASAALFSPITRVKTSSSGISLVSSHRQISQVLLTAATISILGTSRVMSAAASNTAGECANPQGPVPDKIQNLASEVLKVRPTAPFCWHPLMMRLCICLSCYSVPILKLCGLPRADVYHEVS